MTPLSDNPKRKLAIVGAWFLVGLLIFPVSVIVVATLTLSSDGVQWVEFADDLELSTYWLLAAVAFPTLAVWLAGVVWGRRSLLALGASLVGLTIVYGYLMWDDPAVRQPMTFEDVVPSMPGDMDRNEILMRYSGDRALAKEFKEPKQFQSARKLGVRDHFVSVEADQEWLVANSEAVKADWESLHPLRSWVDEVSSWPRIPDLTENYKSELLSFSPLRAVSLRAAAIARIHAIEGRGDEAVKTLLPYVSLTRRLEVTSRTMVRTMIARVILKIMVNEIHFVLDRCELSHDVQTQVLFALQEGGEGVESVGRMLQGEYAFAFTMHANISDAEAGTSSIVPKYAVPLALFYNQNRAINLYWEVMQHGKRLIQARNFDAFDSDVEAAIRALNALPFKNLVGRDLALKAMPYFGKVGKNFWDYEDARIALIDRLQKSIGATF